MRRAGEVTARGGAGALLAAALLCAPAAAYEPATHFEIGGRAVDVSTLDRVMKDQFSVLRGKEQVLRASNGYTLSLRDWVAAGAYWEDVPDYRALNHFHNPLRAWPEAGLRVGGVQIGRASVRWQQAAEQGDGGTWSWPQARRRFHDYLVATDRGEREAALADVARAIGQMSHLIQDATSPPHTRNDAHLVFDGYEKGMEEFRIENPLGFFILLGQPPVFADPGIFTATGDADVPARIARLIDSDLYGGAVPGNGTLFGASEYTNGGYVSDDTIFLDFDFPAEANLGPGFFDPPQGEPDSRRYFPKVGAGDGVSHFVAEGTLWERLSFRGQLIGGYILDTRTYHAAARFLLPRAVGYSAALIDRFFQPEIEISAPARYVYARAPFEDGNTGSFTKLAFRVRKSTPGPGGAGTLTAVVRYRRGLANLIEDPLQVSNDISYAVSQPVSVALGGAFSEVTFDFANSPIPTNSADVYLTVVYGGPAGEEQEAVLFGSKDLFEPDPVDVGNGTDYDCFGPDPHHVADFTVYPPFDLINSNPQTNPQPRDLTVPKDGRPELFGPQDELGGVFMKVSSLQQPQFASAAVWDYSVPQRLARTSPEFVRFFVLQDRPNFLLSWRVGQLVERGTFPVGSANNVLLATVPTANVNRIVDAGGIVVHELSFPFTYRGLTSLNLNLLVPSVPRFNACVDDTFELPPDLVRIDGTPAEP